MYYPEEIVEEREEKNRDPHRFIFGRKAEAAEAEEPATVTPAEEPFEEDIAEDEYVEDRLPLIICNHCAEE